MLKQTVLLRIPQGTNEGVKLNGQPVVMQSCMVKPNSAGVNLDFSVLIPYEVTTGVMTTLREDQHLGMPLTSICKR